MSEDVFYAIGDVHGLARRLGRLHDAILSDAADAHAHVSIVHLGDYVDRGPASCEVLDLVIALQDRLRRRDEASVYALLGNHERMMLDACDNLLPDAERFWMFNGGEETIASYGAARDDPGWRAAIDPAHVAWLRTLPTIFPAPRSGLVFVHAGIEPSKFPECGEDVHLWTRSPRFFDTELWPDRSALRGLRVVHGHTPTDDDCPYVDDRRINVDTGAVFGGPLTCAVLAPGEKLRFLYA